MQPRDLALSVVTAREAVEAGDLDLALVVILELEREVAPVVLRERCACGLTFEWPGLLDSHRARGACSARRAAA